MNFRLSDTFTDSLAKLSKDEQKAVKTTVFDLQVNPAAPGLKYHRFDRVRDNDFRSVRVNKDIRIIVHQTADNLLVCYVDHHEEAYRWAERRKLETHPTTGAAQLVEIRETVREVIVPRYVEQEQTVPAQPFLPESITDEQLLSYGVPQEWLVDARAATEDTIFDLADHLPAEAAEALLDLATGVIPVVQPAETATDPFDHPDAKRRFRVVEDVEQLEQALNAPWEKWAIFLHPAQRDLVEKSYGGPVRVSGSAGTGKTIVALHRAHYLVKDNPDARVLLTTFSDPLANALRKRLIALIGKKPRLGERIEVHALDAIGKRLYDLNFGHAQLAPESKIRQLLDNTATELHISGFGTQFLFAEWEQIVDTWQIKSWEDYRTVQRLGRKTRLAESKRQELWSIFERVIAALEAENLITEAGMFARLAEKYSDGSKLPFDYIVVDEAQDISVMQLRFLAALGGNQPDSLFFAGDLGQRIFSQAFSWKAHGIDIRGRSHTLRINYRTSHQIRMQADRLLEPELSDVDGITEQRRGTISVFDGPKPVVSKYDAAEEEAEAVADWLKEIAGDVPANEIGVFVRSEAELDRAGDALNRSGLSYKVLDENVKIELDTVSVSTMHLAKGLEFRVVVVMACDDEVIPSQARIERIADEADLEEVYNTERHLLYVACTRARDHLLVTGVNPTSEFLDDFTTG